MRWGLAIAVALALPAAAARPTGAAPSCTTLSDRAYAYQHQRGHTSKRLRALERAALACTSGVQPVAFWPQGGLLDHDLYLANTVDLDSGPGIRDPWCGTRTYDTHTGEDVTIRSFREQKIGVPVFAAIDGRVAQVQEGAKDTNYGTQTLPWDNHVQIDSGHGEMEIYGHLRRGSIRVKIGEWVVAGQQLGFTASSGNSSWPHLHLTLIVGDQPVDLWSGPCNATSRWVDQPAIRTDPLARDFTLSAQPFGGHRDLPWDEARRTGTFVQGTRDLWFRSMLFNTERISTAVLQVLRPDGSVVYRTSGAPDWDRFRQAVASWRVRTNLDTVGTWRIQLTLDGAQILDQPFRVVASAGEATNRPPARIAVAVEQAADGVWICRVDTDLLHADPDYDLVSYRYRWVVGGKTVRALTAAGLKDVLPRTFAAAHPVCTVTPTDGRASGMPATAAG